MSDTFEFTPETLEIAKGYIAKYPEGRQASAVLPLLDLAQRQNDNYASDAVIDAVAAMLDMPRIRVVEVASFYTMINTEPVGKYLLQFCTTTPCWLRDSGEVVDATKDHLGIDFGGTTEDGLFTMREVECLGACVNAPIVQVNDDMYEDLTGPKMVELLDALKAGRVPPHGSQTGRQTSAPIGGAQTLTDLDFAKAD
ncbi:MAG: NADH-quinone oxidoreductase subunit NuoE [Alphaproteobacteria bacterium]|nr:NADH-quinone oxidoreductase subunit NuoE [Alphaproteobacteria bacterium]